MATDMMRQEREERDRVQFQQGVETAGGEAVRQWTKIKAADPSGIHIDYFLTF